MSAPRCDVAPWLLPREREPDEIEDVEENYACDDGTEDDDYDDDCDVECEGW